MAYEDITLAGPAAQFIHIQMKEHFYIQHTENTENYMIFTLHNSNNNFYLE